MAIKEQLNKLKENWLLGAVVLVVLLIAMFSGNFISGSVSSYSGGYAREELAMAKGSYPAAEAYYGGGYYPPVIDGGDFAPEVEKRLLTKTAGLTSEIERGRFLDADARLKVIVASNNAFLLDENVNRYGKGRTGYYNGYYQIKVETSDYASMVSQLKELGQIESFQENTEDITGRYTNLQKEIEKEEERLKRYQQMYAEAVLIADKIQLSDLIFNQERTIESLKDWLNNLDQKVDYSTISVTLREEQSGYVSVALVKFSELIRKLVDSFNSLLALVFWILPWAALVVLAWLGVKRFRKKKK